MAQYKTRISGGEVMVRGALVPLDVLVEEGRIAALVRPNESGDAAETIDASGKWVLPGIIDTHAHTREPGYTHKEDFYTASSAGAVGGVTTMIDMPNVEPPTDTLETFEEKRELAAAKSIIDWGHWVAGTNIAEIGKMAEAGATGYKIYQVSGAYPHDPRLAMNAEADLLRAFRSIAEVGLPCLVHPFNQSLFEQLSEDAFQVGKPSNWNTFSEVYTTEAIWHTAVNTLISLQSISNVRLQLVHTHSKGTIELVAAAKDRGQRVSAAVDPKYYHLSLDDLLRLRGRVCPAGYISEDPERMATIWAALENGTIDMIDSDHAPHTLEEIEVLETDAWHGAMGSPQYDWQYSIVLTDVHEGKLSLGRAVELLSEAPARLLGIFPSKGALIPGSDADLVVVDPGTTHTITDDGLQTKVGWSPYVDWEVTGVVDITMLRGKVIAKDRQVLGKPGYGRYIAGVPQ